MIARAWPATHAGRAHLGLSSQKQTGRYDHSTQRVDLEGLCNVDQCRTGDQEKA